MTDQQSGYGLGEVHRVEFMKTDRMMTKELIYGRFGVIADRESERQVMDGDVWTARIVDLDGTQLVLELVSLIKAGDGLDDVLVGTDRRYFPGIRECEAHLAVARGAISEGYSVDAKQVDVAEQIFVAIRRAMHYPYFRKEWILPAPYRVTFLTRAIQILEYCRGGCSVALVRPLILLGGLHLRMRSLRFAQKYVGRALYIAKLHVGRSDPLLISIYTKLAAAHKAAAEAFASMDDLEEAEKLYRFALDIKQVPYLAYRMAECQVALGNHVAAAQHLLRVCMGHYESNNMDLAETLLGDDSYEWLSANDAKWSAVEDGEARVSRV